MTKTKITVAGTIDDAWFQKSVAIARTLEEEYPNEIKVEIY